MNIAAHRAGANHQGFTLIELAVVMAILGVVALAASSMLGINNATSALSAKQDSLQIVGLLRASRANAISTGQSIRLDAIYEGGLIRGLRTGAGGYTAVQPEFRFSDLCNVTMTPSDFSLMPNGTTDRSVEFRVRGTRSEWRLTLVSATGQVDMVQIQ